MRVSPVAFAFLSLKVARGLLKITWVVSSVIVAVMSPAPLYRPNGHDKRTAAQNTAQNLSRITSRWCRQGIVASQRHTLFLVRNVAPLESKPESDGARRKSAFRDSRVILFRTRCRISGRT